jgi:hypothetical protein
MINGVIGKGLTQANINLLFPLDNVDPNYPTVINVNLTNVGTVSSSAASGTDGLYTFSIMDSSETTPTNQDNIFIESPIYAGQSINLGNYVLSSTEVPVINANIDNIAVRVTGIQQIS